MKCFLIFVTICCILSHTWAAATKKTDEQNSEDQTLVTAATFVLKNVCPFGSLGALSAIGLAKAANQGVKAYQDTHDITEATKIAAIHGIDSASSFITNAKSTATGAVNLIHDIQKGKDAKAALNDRTRELTNYLKDELTKNPNGKVANAIITGSNVALTLTVGPIQAWVTANLFKAMSDGLSKYKETNDIKEATKSAASSGYESTSELVKKVCGLIASTSMLAKDLTAGKNPKDAFMKRGSQAIESLNLKGLMGKKVEKLPL